jgi:hypothetical protein
MHLLCGPLHVRQSGQFIEGSSESCSGKAREPQPRTGAQFHLSQIDAPEHVSEPGGGSKLPLQK